MKKLIIISILLFTASAYAEPFDKTEKQLFAFVCVAQIADGMSTVGLLSEGHKIKDIASWKYGTNRPSSDRLWITKGVELGLCYFVAKRLQPKHRK